MITEKTVKIGTKSVTIMNESYSAAADVIADCEKRPITDGRFHDMRKYHYDKWNGVKSYDEALELMRTGYQPTVEQLKDAMKINRRGAGKRITFQNNVIGAAPVVPLALIGVPNCMIDMRMKPIKAKVFDVYYDITTSSGTTPQTIIENGKKILGAIIELERQGYRFNLYAMQTYYEKDSADMLTVRVKSASQPLDIKRVSFPLTHPAFFRAIGFDWYSKTPKGKYRSAYGRSMAYDFSREQLESMAKQMFGDSTLLFTAPTIAKNGQDYIENILSGNVQKPIDK